MNYTVALYIRLSAADEDRDGESDSVMNQRSLLNLYIASNEEFAECNILTFVDDGYTGTNFERPSAKAMLEKARLGQIHCIIVKDFSRFGRNYIEVGDYLEQIFPFLGVRFVSVNDHYDSKNNTGFTAGLDVGFKTFLHSLYSKDISFKVKNGRKAKAEKGEYLCKLAPYGYQKSKTEKNKLIVDEETAPIIRYIYELALDGLGQAAIAKRLNSEKIATPLVHRKNKGTHTSRGWTAKAEVSYWTTSNVGKILRDIRYAGTMVSGRRTQVAPLSKKTKAVPRDEWIVVPNTHEGIVSIETYETVQKLLPKNGGEPFKMDKLSLFSGKVFCGHCGYTLRRLRGKHYYFNCLSHAYISSEPCITDRVYEYAVKDAVLCAFKKSIELAIIVKDEINAAKKRVSDVQFDLTKQLVRLARNERQLSEQKARLFDDFNSGLLSKEQFLESKSEITSELKTTQEQRMLFEAKYLNTEPVTETHYVFELLRKLNSIQEVTPELAALVKRITIFNSERIEIQFTFTDELNRLFTATNIPKDEYLEVI